MPRILFLGSVIAGSSRIMALSPTDLTILVPYFDRRGLRTNDVTLNGRPPDLQLVARLRNYSVPASANIVMQNLHLQIWWGIGMLVMGLGESYFSGPRVVHEK